MWTPSRECLAQPYFLSIADQIAQAVASGVLKPGEQLPPQRQLADKLAVSLPTVSRAYEELSRRGLVTGETGRGTFIRTANANPEAVTPFMPERIPGLIDLAILKPVSDTLHLERMKSALGALAVDLPASTVFGSRPSAMFARHRAIATDWLRFCGVKTDARTVHLTNGGTPALTVALMTACQPGMTIATEATGLHVMLPLGSYLGLKVQGVPIDDHGIIPEALESACQQHVIRALFMMPNALAPTAFIMDEPRRVAIVEIARKYDLLIVEDDALGPLTERDLPTFQTLAPERTIYITSFTKPVMSGLRTGYLVAPERLLPAVENRQLVTSWIATPLIAEIAARWVEDGTCLELVQWQRARLVERHKLVASALNGVSYCSNPGSLHIWLPLDGRFPEDEFVSHARKQGVVLARGAAFAISENHPAVRVSLGSTTEEELVRGLSVIHNLLHSEPEPILL
ncbi:PLP-dependent aminotransferase family protein [Rhizobium sp. 1AS11]|uniref:MocR-like ectoine utilization transcription factor EhuR n=1 Tax=Rhizobium acaciae TaxID=2989736 RepID=UPI0022223F47|nr:PLP-dependent aminotransferase family protein [Rhizobium acaciae]MCW1410674.1 PLP-dependent aminotransferase family protein [Rhizobium acaciae]MCW1743027.1 PLP-dependent aminotransferase family protein [Rhizobium acaciae]